MTTKTAVEIIRAEYGAGPNFMTPDVIRFGKLHPQIAYELSSGSGMESGTTIYGVSLVRWNYDGTTTRLVEHSKCLHSREDAESYIKSLRDQVGSMLTWRDRHVPERSGRGRAP